MEMVSDCIYLSLFPSGCFPVLLPLLEMLGFSLFPQDSFKFVKKVVEQIRADHDGNSHQVCTEHRGCTSKLTDLLILTSLILTLMNHQTTHTHTHLYQKFGDNYLRTICSQEFDFLQYLTNTWVKKPRMTTGIKVFLQGHHMHGARAYTESAFMLILCQGLMDHEINKLPRF